MRDPATNIAEKQRVSDAIGSARHQLWFMIGRLHIDDVKNPAEATLYQAIDFVTRILSDPDADRLVRKYAPAPGARDKILSALRAARPPLRPQAGRRKNTVRDRWIADIVERIRLHGFAPTRGDATREKGIRLSACAIVAAAWGEIESDMQKNHFVKEGRATLLKLGFTPLLADLRIQGLQAGAKALSEKHIERIWKKHAKNRLARRS
jgi:hypothetical protein